MKTKNPIKHRSLNAHALADHKHRQRVKPDKRKKPVDNCHVYGSEWVDCKPFTIEGK